MTPSERKNIVTVLVIALLFKTVFLVWFAFHPALYLATNDGTSYVEETQSFLNLGDFGSEVGGKFFPTMYPVPFYILFLAAIFRTAGVALLLVAVIQMFLSLFCIFLVWKIAFKLFGRSTAFWSTLLLALEPFSAMYFNLPMTENLFTVFLLLFFWFWIRYSSELKTGLILLCGISLALATLTRPISQFLAIIVICSLIFLWLKDRAMKKRLAVSALVFLAAFFLTMSPWLVRNYRVFGAPKISTITSYNLSFYNAATFLAVKNGTTRTEEGRKIWPDKRWLDPSEVLANDKMLTQKALGIIFADPAGYAKFHLVKTLPFFVQGGWDQIAAFLSGRSYNPPSVSSLVLKGDLRPFFDFARVNFLNGFFLLYLFGAIFWLAVSLGLAGFILFFSRLEQRIKLQAAFLLVAVIYFALLSVPILPSRLRLPIEPIMFILSIAGWFGFFQGRSTIQKTENGMSVTA